MTSAWELGVGVAFRYFANPNEREKRASRNSVRENKCFEE
jgi:hypothetical protein